MRILVVEDDDILRDGLEVGLRSAGFSVETVASLADARAGLAAGRFDVIVLDLMLPDGSGLDLLNEIRRSGSDDPVLLLTARDKVEDRIAGLDHGADDYLVKPFDLDELAARLRALVRRVNGRAQAYLIWDHIQIVPATMELSVSGTPVSVSRREFAVLQSLMESPTVIQSKRALEEKLYGWQEEIESNAIEVHIHHLRQKVGRDAIETVRGLGYRMRKA